MVIWEESVDYTQLVFKQATRSTKKRESPIADAVCAFDIETSRFSELEQSLMYIWQFCIDWPDGKDLVILGRTWPQFDHMLQQLRRRLSGMQLLIWVHNLSYEFQFLSGVYSFENDDVFAMEPRSILTCQMYKHFQFRCSYKLFNMSLSVATAKYAPDYHKRDGRQFGYDERRFSDTPLTRKELLYCVYDVWGLCKAVRGIMALFQDDVYTIPRTSTGYVRREVKREMRPYFHQLTDAYPDWNIYTLLRAAFRGGNTHANRFYAGEILDHVASVDISSSYPTQQCTKLFPAEPFRRSYDFRESYINYCLDRGRCFLMRCRLDRLQLRDRFTPIPYLPVAKCLALQQYLSDNGRIIRADAADLVITDVDYRIIRDQYDYDLTIEELYLSWYGPLPQPLVEINKRYFVAKTQLKGVPGQELQYMKSKNLLNSIYGMSVMDPVRMKILYDHGEYNLDATQPAEMLLEKSSRQPYTLYQYGVWTTAQARADLQRGIDICGDSIVYVDTDSCKYLTDGKLIDFSAYNDAARAAAAAAGCYADDPSGSRHYMGVYEDDGQYNRFITLGAKKYAVEDADGRLHITIAGVPKKSGAVELAAAGGLEAFKPGFVFRNTGKLEAIYNDGSVRGVTIDGHVVDITNNVVLRPTTYELGITRDYAKILDDSAKMVRKVKMFVQHSRFTKTR